MNNEPIDIVIPWLNPTNKWFEEYKKYSENENLARIRDLNTMHPTIKSILKNLPWIRYIWLIVYDEEQIPEWEELKNEKIKFVFHRDIIPQEFLPNFNSFLTLLFVHKIDELSENFIKSSDDMVFTKPVPKEFFFQNNKCVHRNKNLSIYPHSKMCMYHEICSSTADFISKIFGQRYLAEDNHISIPLKKSLLMFLFEKYKNQLLTAFADSKIRKKNNIILYRVAFTIEEIENMCIFDKQKNIKTAPIWLSDKTTKQEIEKLINNNHIVCLNDSEMLINKADEIANFIKELL